jgi:hypothetical protein
MTVKSPFLIYQDFISPKLCDHIISKIAPSEYDTDIKGNRIKVEKFDYELEKPLVSNFKNIVGELEAHYNFKYKGLEHLTFQCFPEGMNDIPEKPHCENAQFVRKKWVKYKDRDITGILWLKDYQNKTPLDRRYETYGGRLEFPIHNFSFQPQRGTLVLYPSGPHFISATSQVLVGDWFGVRFHIAAEALDGNMWFYNPNDFPGDFSTWFIEHI